MATPAFRFLRQSFPDARIECLCPPSMAGLEPFFPWLDELVPFRCPWSPAYRDWSFTSLRHTVLLAWKLRRNRYDWAFDLRGDMRDIAFLFVTGATRRAAFGITGGKCLLTDVVPYDDQPYTHQLQGNVLAVAQPLGVRPGEEHFECSLTIPPDWREEARRWLQERGLEEFIAVHPGASRAHQLWPAASWIELLNHVLLPKAPVVIFGAEKDTPAIAEIRQGLGQQAPVHVAQVPLELFFALISMAKAVICLDSGSAHVAAATGVPVVVLHGPRPASLNGAYSPRARPVYLEEVHCRPCGRHCTQQRNFCMQDLPVGKVTRALHDLQVI